MYEYLVAVSLLEHLCVENQRNVLFYIKFNCQTALNKVDKENIFAKIKKKKINTYILFYLKIFVVI